MYRCALSLRPDDVEIVKCQAYVEMLEAGFMRVGEFYYLRHDGNGRSYAEPAEMCERICAAAVATGIGLTLLPVFYAHGGFGGAAPGPAQHRFVCNLDLYARLLTGARRAAAALPGALVGVAPHSLRAVAPTELTRDHGPCRGRPDPYPHDGTGSGGTGMFGLERRAVGRVAVGPCGD
jgi:formimidoylglutamate deiminase